MCTCIHAVPGGGKLVDIGTGATVHTLITASAKFKDITCAEYTEVNRRELKKWLAGEQNAFDWSLFFKFVAIIEGHRYAIKHVRYHNDVDVCNCEYVHMYIHDILIPITVNLL